MDFTEQMARVRHILRSPRQRKYGFHSRSGLNEQYPHEQRPIGFRDLPGSCLIDSSLRGRDSLGFVGLMATEYSLDASTTCMGFNQNLARIS